MTLEEEKAKIEKDTPRCCVGCLRWKSFGRNCWYYWEGKKHCTMWTNEISELSGGDILI